MTDEGFNLLAAKLLAGEASREETRELEELLAADSRRKQEFDELKVVWSALGEYAPLASALEAPPAALPEHHSRELVASVRNHFSRRPSRLEEKPRRFGALWQWITAPNLLGASVAVVMLILAVFLVQRTGRWPLRGNPATTPAAYLLAGPAEATVLRDGHRIDVRTITTLRSGDEIILADGVTVQVLSPAGPVLVKGPAHLPVARLNSLAVTNGKTPSDRTRTGEGFQTALFRPLPEVLAAGLLASSRSSQGLALYSPRGAARELDPLILWRSDPGKTYDVSIADELDNKIQPWRVQGAVSPLEFSKVEAWKNRPLAPDGLYRIQVRETGNPLSTCEYTFRTLNQPPPPSAPTPTEKIADAYALMTTDAPCLGDALADLMTLPPGFAKSELVLRLELALYGRLGLPEEYESTAAQLKGLVAPQSQ